MIDLHIHSIFSDGIFDIKKLKLMGKENNFSALSITDHDNIQSCTFVKDNNLQDDCIFIPGIEMSTESYFFNEKLKLHLLGYGFDYNNQELIDALDYIYSEREKTNRLYVENLISKFDFLSEDMFSDFKFGKYGRIKKNILRHISLKLNPSQLEILKEYLDNNIPTYKNYSFDIEYAIKILLNAGGYPVVAHPFQYGIDDDSLDKLIKHLKSCGLSGIEVYHNDASIMQTKFYHQLAKTYNLFETGGSDCHSGKLGSKHDDLLIYGSTFVKKLILERKNIGN